MSELSSALISAGLAGAVGGGCELRLLGWFVVLEEYFRRISRGFAKGEMWSRAYGVHMDGG